MFACRISPDNILLAVHAFKQHMCLSAANLHSLAVRAFKQHICLSAANSHFTNSLVCDLVCLSSQQLLHTPHTRTTKAARGLQGTATTSTVKASHLLRAAPASTQHEATPTAQEVHTHNTIMSQTSRVCVFAATNTMSRRRWLAVCSQLATTRITSQAAPAQARPVPHLDSTLSRLCRVTGLPAAITSCTSASVSSSTCCRCIWSFTRLL